MEFGFTAPNAHGFDVAVKRFVTDLSDFRSVWKDVAFPTIEKIEAAEFRDGGGRWGAHGKWAPLSSKYYDWKTRLYKGETGRYYWQVLSLSGALEQSLTGTTKDSIRISERTSFSFGSNLKYGAYHQKGEVPNAPARRPIDPPRNPKGTPWYAIVAAIRSHAQKTGRKRMNRYADVKPDPRTDAIWRATKEHS